MKNKTLESFINDISIFEEANTEKLPPVHKWKPEYSGKMDLIIDSQGDWKHDGAYFKRRSIVNLFSKLLLLEGNKYFLISPTEKWEIKVSVAPFVVVSVDRVELNSVPAIKCTTLTEQVFLIGKSHPIWLDNINSNDNGIPFTRVRDNLNAFFNRSSYYRLIDMALENKSKSKEEISIHSLGIDYPLGLTA